MQRTLTKSLRIEACQTQSGGVDMLFTSRDPYRDKSLYINCPILINQESIIPMKTETC